MTTARERAEAELALAYYPGQMSYNLLLTELRAIRELLEWQKADTLQRRAEIKAEEEAHRVKRKAKDAEDKAYFLAVNEQMLEKSKQIATEAQRQAAREHEERYHGRPKEKPEIVQ